MKIFPRPTGQLQGDDKPLGNAGTGTGTDTGFDSMGMSIEGDATNSKGGIGSATKSNPVDQCANKEDRI